MPPGSANSVQSRWGQDCFTGNQRLRRCKRRSGPERELRLIELLLRAGVADDRLAPALLEDVVPHLDDPVPGTRMRQCVEVDGRLAIGAALLRAGGDVEGSAISDTLLDWLADATPLPGAEELAEASAWDPIWIRAALRGIRAGRGGSVEPGDSGAQLWWLRATASPHFDRAVADSVWDRAHLLLALGADPIPGAAVVRTLVGGPDSPALTELADRVIDGNDDTTAVACAAVRYIEPQIWMHQRYVETHQRAYLPFWDQALGNAEPGGVHHDFAVRLLTFALLGVIAGQPYPQACTVLAAAMPGEESDVDAVTMLMTQLSGDASDGTVRRYRKMVGRLLARRNDAQPSLAARLRGSR
jgi:hypothetical protein